MKFCITFLAIISPQNLSYFIPSILISFPNPFLWSAFNCPSYLSPSSDIKVPSPPLCPFRISPWQFAPV
ncbi:unnamed protein product [Moneuplotes crassus]|uniref:Uncharacterized protein n=1 Tax=Euplotes crassus TaxID=5936 RepID=A0AAD1XXT6_EUPCR|nr:unnamed protein product [Moneuplotes crassus]